MLCTVLPSASLKEASLAFREVETALSELRLDLIPDWTVEDIRTQFEMQRLVIKSSRDFEALAELQPAYLDMDDAEIALEIKKQFPKQKIIYSIHDFEKMADPEALFREGSRTGADIIKIAVKVSSSQEALLLLLFQREKGKRALVIGMGDEGVITRVAGLKFGMPFSYAAFDEKAITAPGQLTVSEMESVYRASKINRETALFGLIGSPVTRSIGQLHNDLMCRKNSRYFKMRVESEELQETLALLKEVGFSGISVTMPLKEEIKEGELVNTVSLKDGRLANTDGPGALRAIFSHTRPTSVAILGTGAAARAVERALAGEKIPVRLVSRKTFDTAVFTEPLIINATPSEMPIQLDSIPKESWIMEMTVRPKETSFLRAARERGHPVIYGYEMWVHQAALQLKFWLELNPEECAKELFPLAEKELNRVSR